MKNVILIVDDQDNVLRDLGGELTSSAFNVHKTISADEAKKIVLSEKLDYAIVDLKIDYHSEFGGIEVIKFIKRHQPGTKVLVLSAYSLTPDIVGSTEVDIDGYIGKGDSGNYIKAVLAKIGEIDQRRVNKKCFVIMPFSGSTSCTEAQWTEAFENCIKPGIENAGFDYVCKRSEPVVGSIIEEVLDDLNRSDLVVADLTDRNPNVYYELGVRHALRDSTILIAQRLSDIPFDLRPYATHVYDWTTRKGRATFGGQMQSIIRVIEADRSKGASPVRKYLRIS